MNSDSDYADAPAEARQHFERALAYEEKGEFQQALRECEATIQLASNWAEAHNLRGIILEELDRPEEAIAAYQEAIRLDPTFDEAKENLSVAEAELNEARNSTSKFSTAPLNNSPSSLTIDPFESERYTQAIRDNQNLGLGILGGVMAAVVGAALWAIITVAINYQIAWMAIGVGFLVG